MKEDFYKIVEKGGLYNNGFLNIYHKSYDMNLGNNYIHLAPGIIREDLFFYKSIIDGEKEYFEFENLEELKEKLKIKE